MAYALPYPKFRAFNPTTNLPLVGGKLYSYIIGTTTPKALYADYALTTPLSNPVILDSNGEKTIYGNGFYDLKLTDASDVQLWTGGSVAFDQAAAVVVNTSLEWVSSMAATFVDVDDFNVSGDQTAIFHVNRRVKAVHTGTTLYGKVTASVFNSGPNTTTVTVLLDSGNLAADLQTASVGILDSVNHSIPAIIPFLNQNNTFIGTNTFSAAVTMGSTAAITGNTTVGGTLGVTGAVTTSSTVAVGTNLTVGGTAIVTGNTTLNGTLAVTGAVTGSSTAQFTAIGVGVAPPAAGKIQTSGDIEAGGLVSAANGFKQPGTGGETLKMIRGIVDSAGAVIEGSGFTAVRNSTGNFTITFSTAFSDIPSFTGTPVAATGNRSITILSATTTQINYENRANNDNALANNDHHIIVIGPK
jgi:hypothetical protein